MPRRSLKSHEPCALASVNGRVGPVEHARIPIDDWGFRYGWGLFETIRVHHDVALFRNRHFERMRLGCEALGLDFGRVDWWSEQVRRLIERSRVHEGAMHLYITRGSGPRFVPARLIVVRPAPNRHRETGKVWLAPWRIDPRNPSVGSKTMAYFPNVMASDRAERSGFDDVIIINTRGRVADGARASVFTVEGGDLRTPSFRDGALAGVVRQILIDAARSHGMRVRLGGLTPATLLKADAVFLSSSLRGLRLAHQVGNQALRTTPRAARAFDTLRSSYRLAIRRELLSRQP